MCSVLSRNSEDTTWLLADLCVLSWTRILISEIFYIVVSKKMSSSEEFTGGDKISHFDGR